MSIASPPNPAVVRGNGSRFVLDGAPQEGFTRMSLRQVQQTQRDR